MAVRTTQGEVAAIAKLRDGDDLTPFIRVANALVTQACAPAGYTDEHLKDIETWLSAHFYKILRPDRLQAMAGSVQQQIESKVDLGLSVTRYGQMAMLLDYKGGLKRIDKAPGRIRDVRWVGRDQEAET